MGAHCYLVIGGRRDGVGAMRRVGRCEVEVSRKGCPCHWLIRCQSLSSTDRQDQPGGADRQRPPEGTEDIVPTGQE